MLKGKKIVLGITGSIAAYKSCLIIRELIKSGAEVQVVITPAGKEFITPITLSALTHKPVVSEFFSQKDGTWNSHVDLGLWADAMVIAPCTAATLGKMANGVADNMLITTYLSMKAPVFIAPAMDLDMYKHASTQKNIRTLRSFGNHIIEPGSGFLASGLEGKGRMEEPENIVKALVDFFSTSSESQSYIEDLKNKTREETIKRENDRIENEYVGALLDKLIETTTIDVPVSMVQAEIQNRLKELEYQLSMQGFKMDDYLKMMGGNIDTFAAQLTPAAEKKVKVDLILDKIARENKFEASEEELNGRMEEIAKMYGMDVPTLEGELKKNNNLDNFKASVKYDIVMKKAIDEVVKNAK